MFRFWTLPSSLFSISMHSHRLSRAIFQHSRLATHNLLILLLALSPIILFSVCANNCLLVSSLVSLTHSFLVWTCMKMFRFWTSSICLFPNPMSPYRLSRAGFSCMASTQFAHLITCLTTYHFVFSLFRWLPLSQFTCFTYTNFLVWTCLIMFCFWASSICIVLTQCAPTEAHQSHSPTHFHLHVQHTIHWLHYLPCLRTFSFGLHTLSHFCQFTYYILLSLVMPAHVSFPCFTHLLSFHPSELPWSSHRLPPKSVGPTILTCKEQPQSPFVFWHTLCVFHSSPQNPHHPVQAPPISHLNWSDETPLYHYSAIMALELTPLKAASL